MKKFLFFLAASFLAFQVDASLLGDDGLKHADDDKGFPTRDLGDKPAMIEEKIEVCHLYRESEQCGHTYKTLYVHPNAETAHTGHGDVVAGCGEEGVFSMLCAHRGCYDDYFVGSDMCQCFSPAASDYLCGGRTVCIDDECTCSAGYEGDAYNTNPGGGCTDIDNCDPNPCWNGGNCTDKVNDYTCECVPGYTDKDCGVNIDDCDPNPCYNSGDVLTK
jgi:hypothetical protein